MRRVLHPIPCTIGGACRKALTIIGLKFSRLCYTAPRLTQLLRTGGIRLRGALIIGDRIAPAVFYDPCGRFVLECGLFYGEDLRR